MLVEITLEVTLSSVVIQTPIPFSLFEKKHRNTRLVRCAVRWAHSSTERAVVFLYGVRLSPQATFDKVEISSAQKCQSNDRLEYSTNERIVTDIVTIFRSVSRPSTG